jgi:hypothetical protein
MDAKKLIKSLGYTQGLILAPHLDRFLEQNNDFSPELKIGGVKEDDGHFHPSYHCQMTVEELVKDRLNPEPETYSASTKKTFDTGHFWHGYIQAALVEMGFVAPENVERKFLWPLPDLPVYGFETVSRTTPLRVSGTVDLLDVEIPGKGTWLVDIKTTASHTFLDLEKTGLYPKYVAQVNVYADRAERNNALILVVEKDSPHRFREIQIQRDSTLLAEIYERWLTAAEVIGNEQARP